ncbi:glycoside hydrolase family 5 protein [Candidatus Parcubacteria bacterium]|nr:glycoside hydrolase family 5 protein [Patescibacteria group bacterium]MBU4308918.1 glycoside hydrolase family 5 protein [Patescibacteria group bacterium]MBU4431854.1 glycoside hydrolase family 5 protein [Patescibacteria group bacterium]MBU4577278.1 glycoside hydrolase family 5 protein [Patescibacteria group bacterium]MCG2696968.1 glycoside hydrolase family 5 protein [Candidatus Parcubacteria bacterium]
MKIKIIFLSLIILLLPTLRVHAGDLGTRLSGRILIQTERSGEAWYVDPVLKKRFYMGQPADAFAIMRNFGLGVKNTDLNRIAKSDASSGDTNLAKRLAGRILLQVESRGEAWYVNPLDNKRYFLGSPTDSYKLMQKLGLGVTDANIDLIEVGNLAYIIAGLQNGTDISRGFNVDARLSEGDFQDLAKTGANLVRINFAFAPLISKQAPYNYNEESFQYLDEVVFWGEKYGLKIIIDPHTYPGTANDTHMRHDDSFWQDYKYQDLLVGLWKKIALRYHGKGEAIAGYSLLNEPFLPNNGAVGTPADYNGLLRRLIKEIRSVDQKHAIIISSPEIMPKGETNEEKRIRRIDGISYLEKPVDNNLLYDVHMYEPFFFTHQIGDKPTMYPGLIEGEVWDEIRMEKYLAPIMNFSNKYKVRIMMGEFSTVRSLGDSGNNYIHDVIELCEKYKWSWAYHVFRSSPMWDAEMSNYDANQYERNDNTPRMELLRTYFKRNK